MVAAFLEFLLQGRERGFVGLISLAIGLHRALACLGEGVLCGLAGALQRGWQFAAAPRWTDLARSGEQTVAFADFERVRQLPGPLTQIPVSGKSPLRRERTLICDAPDHPACVAGWEHPGQGQSRDQDRIFEALWSIDHQVVRSAAWIGIELAAVAAPALTEQLQTRLSGEPGPGSADLHRVSSVLERILDYVAAAAGHTRAAPTRTDAEHDRHSR